MTLVDVQNIVYSSDVGGSKDISVLFSNGSTAFYSIGELEYPYFYANYEYAVSLKSQYVHDVEIVRKKVLRASGIEEVTLGKISALSPAFINRLSSKASYTCEAHIPYLERRLGADGVVEFASAPARYAYIDIEEVKGKIAVIGYIDSIENVYYPLKTVNDFLIKCSENKIVSLVAWNGAGYDFLRLDQEIKKTVTNKYLLFRWNIMLKFDAMLLYATYTQSNLISLDKAAKLEEVGEKIVLNKKFEELTWDELVTYNKNDVVIMQKIVEKSGVLNIPFIISNLTGIRVDKLSTIKVLDNLMMKQKKYLLFDEPVVGSKEKYEGAFIMAPVVGLHYNVAVLDIDHLYPSVVEYEDYNGRRCREVYYEVRNFIKLFNSMRAEAKKKYANTKEEVYNVQQKSYKVLSNGIYGVFGNEYYRFHDKNIAQFITSSGRKVRQRLEDIVKQYGYTPIGSDTDSIFIENITPEEAEKLKEVVNRTLYPYQVKVEKYFTRMINFAGSTGAEVKKRYVGLTDKGELLYTGIEIVRGEYPEVTKAIEERVLEMVLKEQATEAEVRRYLSEEYEKFKTRPITDFIQSKVIDLDKIYKAKTTVVKVFESLGKAVNEVSTKRKKGDSEVSVTGYKLGGDSIEKLVEVSYILTEKNEPIGIDETQPISNYEQYINRDFYWDKFVVLPLSRLFISLGWGDLEKKYVKPSKKRKKIGENL